MTVTSRKESRRPPSDQVRSQQATTSPKYGHLTRSTKSRRGLLLRPTLIILLTIGLLSILVLSGRGQHDLAAVKDSTSNFLSTTLSTWNVAADGEPTGISTTITAGAPDRSPLRFVTVVIPSVVDPQHRSRRLDSIAATWANESRALIVVHNLSLEYPSNTFPVVRGEDDTLSPSSSVSISFPQVLVLPSNITEEKHGFERLEYVVRHIYKHFDPDYIFLVNDHTYVIPQHLCSYLKDRNPDQEDLYAGRAMKNPGGEIFNSGAAGFVMSRRTVKRLLAEAWDVGKCLPTAEWMKNNPDLVIAICFQQDLKITAEDTRDDATKNKQLQHRFHSYGIVRTVLAQFDDWYYKVHDRFQSEQDGFGESYRTILGGEECCSSETISFHYVEYSETRVLYELLQMRLSRQKDLSDSEIRALVEELWPHPSTLGGYSRRLPKEGDADVDVEKFWTGFVGVMRKLSSDFGDAC